MPLILPRNEPTPDPRHFAKQEIFSAQVRLLYDNAKVSGAGTMLCATLLAFLEWGSISHTVVAGWWIYIACVAAARYVLARRFSLASPAISAIPSWLNAFIAGAGLAGFGWGAAGFLLYQEANLANQVFLVFVIGGMVLGASSLLAARPEAFLAFLIPTCLGPTLRLSIEGDTTHVAMAVLAAAFTSAVLITSTRIYRTIESSLGLQFENRGLLDDVHAAKSEAEELNRVLERRVQERTNELNQSTMQLRAEITQRELMEEELLRARKLESLGVLAGGIAHDFNNFLTVVQGNTEIAKAKLEPWHPVQEILDLTATTCLRAAFLSSQLLTFAKGGAPVRRVVSLARLLFDAVQLARAGAPISISVHVPDDLYFAEVDPSQIAQVFHNILLNARQAMPEGGIIEVAAANVESSRFDVGPRIRISVRDYGCGIAPDHLSRIFDPYFTTKPGGTGLGLATSYSIIARHDGHISVESKPGEGATFVIELPACREKPAPETPVAPGIRTGKERILVMDDEEALRALLRTVLADLGYEVQAARDGAEAIALYERAKSDRHPFDAVLLDLTVSGGMGGREAAARLKEIDPSAKLIVSSGYSDSPVMAEYRQFGFEAVLPKPWTATELSRVLRMVILVDSDRRRD
jgi:signal transduction histidine kinase/ActR/RegA family two-component response regulator